MRKRNVETSNQARPSRTPVHEQKDKLTVETDPNYQYRWVNSNDPKRVEVFKKAGYEVAPDVGQVGDSVTDSQVTQTTGVTERYMGGGTKAILMRIRRDWYEEDQAKKAEDLDAREKQMLREAKQDRYGELKVEQKKAQF